MCKIKLKYVTLTGADESVDPAELARISRDFPFVEWGVLFSKSRSGKEPRYPGHGWVQSLAMTRYHGNPMNLSAHLCGEWMRDVLAGRFTIFEGLDGLQRCELFGRVQLNLGMNISCGYIRDGDKGLLVAMQAIRQPVVLGGRYEADVALGKDLIVAGCCPLFDTSGGRGLQPKEWRRPQMDMGEPVFCGYAGGLGPDNIEVELEKIASAAGDALCWIDMESSLRSDVDGKDVFSLEKCREILQMCRPWVEGR